MSNRKIEITPVSDLKPRSSNPRTHSKKQIRQIADSIKQFGFNNPILVDRDNTIVAGQGRVEAARLLGIETVPTIPLEDLTEAEIRAYVIADNRLAELAGWNRELLAIELQGLIEVDLDFDVTITGFEMPEIDILIGELDADEEDDPADEVPELGDGPPVTRPGDIWCIGKHRLICGDSTDPDTYARLLDGAEAQMVFTDPPYNVPIDGHVSGLGNPAAPLGLPLAPARAPDPQWRTAGRGYRKSAHPGACSAAPVGRTGSSRRIFPIASCPENRLQRLWANSALAAPTNRSLGQPVPPKARRTAGFLA